MAIAYFPNTYNDELIYSVLARFYVHSGYLTQGCAAQELFGNERYRVEKEFVKNIKPEIVDFLTRNMSLEELLEKHTMLPCYGRFIDSERRIKAYCSLKDLNGDFSKLFSIPNLKKGEQRFLRYCPLCVQADRKNYGETYWHRIHQLRDVDICSYHNCHLENSIVSLDSRANVFLVSAEEVIDCDEALQKDIKFCSNPLELELVKYMVVVFQSPMSMGENSASVGEFFQYKMIGTPYLTTRGERIYFHRLWEDLRKYYQELDGVEYLTALQIQKMLRGRRYVFMEFCMLALFLNINVEELTKLERSKSVQQLYDENVKSLRNQGLGINEIIRTLDTTYSTVKTALDTVDWNKKARQVRSIHTDEKINWSELDKQILPLVKQVICKFQGINGEMPQKVSVYAVAKEANILSSRFQKMPLCKQEIEKSLECIEKHHARKILWGINKLQQNGEIIKFWKVFKICSTKKNQIYACLPYLEQMATPEVLDIVKSIL